MTTLDQVQESVRKQLVRDYSESEYEFHMVQTINLLGLAEEAGEVAGLGKRRIRNQDSRNDGVRCTRGRFIDELGDVLWYLAAVCETEGTTLQEVWDHNVEKLKERYEK